MESRLQIEMSISSKDFYRLLPVALKNCKHQIRAGIISVDNGKVMIYPGQEFIRKIASLKLPVLSVEFVFFNISEEASSVFMSNFRRVYQKGGG